MVESVALIAGGILLMICALVLLGWLCTAAWILYRAMDQKLERIRRGTIASPFGPLEQPTNRELRRARKEFSGDDCQEIDIKEKRRF